MAKKTDGKKTVTKGSASTKKTSGKWNINIRVAENGYIVSVYEATNDYPAKEFTFIAKNEKELNEIVEKYK